MSLVRNFGDTRIAITLTGEEWFAFLARVEGKPLSAKGSGLYAQAAKGIQQQLIRASNDCRKSPTKQSKGVQK